MSFYLLTTNLLLLTIQKDREHTSVLSTGMSDLSMHAFQLHSAQIKPQHSNVLFVTRCTVVLEGKKNLMMIKKERQRCHMWPISLHLPYSQHEALH